MQHQHNRFKSSIEAHKKPVQNAALYEVMEQNKKAHTVAKEEPKKVGKFGSMVAVFACVLTVAVASLTGVTNPLNSASASQVIVSAEAVQKASVAQRADALEHAIEKLQDNSIMQQYLIAIDNDPSMNVIYDNLKAKLEDSGVLLRVSDSNQKKLVLAVASYIGASQAAGKSVKEMENQFTEEFFNKLSPSDSSSVNDILFNSAKNVFNALKDQEISPDLQLRALSLGFSDEKKELSMS